TKSLISTHNLFILRFSIFLAETRAGQPEETSILSGSGTNGRSLQRTQSRREALIPATTQMARTADKSAAFGPTMAAAALASDAAPNRSGHNVAINNIGHNGDQRLTAALGSNLIMSSRNVLEQHSYRITQGDNATSGAPFPAASSSSTLPTTTTTTTEPGPTTTTTRRTTRRPVPTTTLKPPPTIDDYQTIISQAGTHAYLPCNVKQLVKKPISWLRMRDGHILTVDQTTFIADQRFQSVFSPNPERWSLQIKYVQLKDEGTYECQVSTEPKASAIVHLRIVEPKTELIGESTRHVKAGSQVKLRCIISQALEPPLFINWFYNQKQIYLHNRRGWRTEIERIELPAEVPTTSTTTASTTTASTSSTTTASTTTTATHATFSGGSTAASTSASDSLNGLPTITRSYILDAMPANDVASAPVAETSTAQLVADVDAPSPTTVHAPSPTASAAAAFEGAITITTAAAGDSAAAASTTSTPATDSTAAATEPATTTTMLPSSSFIKQITTASLIIPAVVKLDSGNYTCSPSNSAPRTIVLHVLNGEYSASAIKSGSVSWRALIGCHGYLHWRNVSTLLTLLWIIKFALARDICQPNASTAAARTPPPAAGAARGEGAATGPKSGVGFIRVTSSISATKVAEDKT
ncbi:hypothetical protein KR018_001245, partial [Drosophila ironensis]